MRPINFHDREVIFTSDDPTVFPLPVLPITYSDGNKGLASCWEPGLKDILRIIFGRPVYLILLGVSQPPALLTTDLVDIIGPPSEQKPDPTWNGNYKIEA